MIKIARKMIQGFQLLPISDVLLFISSQKSISIRYFLKIKLKIVSFKDNRSIYNFTTYYSPIPKYSKYN